jgi:hypothetical protein
VLPLWSKPESLYLGATKLSLHHKAQTISIDLPFDEKGVVDFYSLSNALPQAFQSLKRPIISVGQAWTKHTVLPWQGQIFSDADLQALAMTTLSQRTGKPMDSWRFKVSDQGFQQPYLSVAMHSSIIDGLEHLATVHDWSLTGIDTAFISLNKQYHRHWQENAHLLMVEQEGLLLASQENGVWTRFTQMRSQPELLESQANMLIKQAEQFTASPEEATCYVHSADVNASFSFLEATVIDIPELSQMGAR